MLRDVVRVRELSTRKRFLMASRGEETVHGFGIAWTTSAQSPFGILATLNEPLSDVNVRRVTRAVCARLAIAHLRCCACQSCPATSYAPSSYPNTQPFIFGDIVFTHIGIIEGHLDLVRKECFEAAQTIRIPDAGEMSDSVFLFQVILSYYLSDDSIPPKRKLLFAIRKAFAALIEAGVQPSSLNVAAADSETIVCCRYRAPGDQTPPPPLFVASSNNSTYFASAPVVCTDVDTWTALAANEVVVLDRSQPGKPSLIVLMLDQVSKHQHVDDDDLESLDLMSSISGSGSTKLAINANAKVKQQSTDGRRRNQVARWLKQADTELRAETAQLIQAIEAPRRNAKLTKAIADTKKNALAEVRQNLNKLQLNDVEFENAARTLLDNALAQLSNAQLSMNPDSAQLELCGSGIDGELARSLLRELCKKNSGKSATALEALAIQQAKLYDARFEEAERAAAGSDRAGVEEVKDVMKAEAEAFRRALSLALLHSNTSKTLSRELYIVDFGSGDGRFCAEFVRAAEALSTNLFVVAYEVSAGALRALRRRCLHNLGYTASSDGLSLATEKVTLILCEGDPLETPAIVCDRLSQCLPESKKFDMVLSGWGSTSAIPDLPGQTQRQLAFDTAFARLAPVLLQIVSSPNNFLKPQAEFQRLRSLDMTPSVAACLRLATTPGSFYYPVAEHEYFYTAVSATEEHSRLRRAGFEQVHLEACNVASFRDLTNNPVLAKLERLVLHFINRDDRAALETILFRAVSMATRRGARWDSRPLRRRTPLFDSNQTLIHQLARYIISISSIATQDSR